MIKSVGGQINGEEPKWVLEYNQYYNQKQKEREFLKQIRKLRKELKQAIGCNLPTRDKIS